MYKTLCVAALLLPTFALSQETKSTSASTFNSPQIVAKAKLVNQIHPIPITTIFTPAESGLYRLSVYGTITKVDPSSGSAWIVSLFWNDDSGPLTTGLLAGYGNTAGPFLLYPYYAVGGYSVVLQVRAQGQVSFSVAQAVHDNSAYSLYYTLERLE